MSDEVYCRFGNRDNPSDVSVAREDGVLMCRFCSLGRDFECLSFTIPEALLAHLDAHRARGHAVPDSVRQKLAAEIAAAREETP